MTPAKRLPCADTVGLDTDEEWGRAPSRDTGRLLLLSRDVGRLLLLSRDMGRLLLLSRDTGRLPPSASRDGEDGTPSRMGDNGAVASVSRLASRRRAGSLTWAMCAAVRGMVTCV